MLGKLMKAEMKATQRVFLPLLAMLLVSSILASVFGINYLSAPAPSENIVLKILSGITIFLYIVIAVGSVIAASIILVLRFYKHLLGDEGYLMFTLPVPVWQHIAAKGLIGIFWMIISGLTGFLSILVMSQAIGPMFPEFLKLLRDFGKGIPVYSEMLGRSSAQVVITYTLGIFLLVVLSIASALLLIYASVAIGHLWSNHRILGSVLAYIGINTVSNVLSVFILPSVFRYVDRIDQSTTSTEFTVATIHFMERGSLISLGIAVIFCVALFAITHYILNKRLNLE